MKKSVAFLLAMFMLVLSGCAGESKKVVDYTVDVPTGFEEVEMEGTDACWMHSDSSSVNLIITNKDKSFSKVTADALREGIEENFEAVYGVGVTITDRFFTNDEVSGMPAYQYSYELDLAGVKLTQLIVGVDADKTYTITYTDATGNWISDFENSAKNIQFVTE